jgi:CHAD domain-containing protein
MQPLAQLSRDLADPAAVQGLLDLLSTKYSLKELPPKKRSLTFFDTFDWRLYTSKQLCYLRGTTLYLTDFSDRQLAAPLAGVRHSHRLLRQFPESELKDALAQTIGVRALLEQSSFSEITREVQVLNKDKKIVASILVQEHSPADETRIYSVQLREVRGYTKWFLKISRYLDRFGSPRPDTRVHTLITVMAAAQRCPMEYSSGFSVLLNRDMDSLMAARKIYTTLLTAMQTNQQGICDDLDSEFLHDFRVAIRRTRSGLSLIKDVLDPEISSRFKKDFRYLGAITGPVRDLDVYLLMEDNYKARLPEHLQEGLHYFFQDLAKRRSREQKKLVRSIQGTRCQSILHDWQQYLESEHEDAENNSRKPVKVLAGTIITKRFKRILRDGRAIGPDSPDEELHRLRIQGKKMRYCLEFFSSLYPAEEMKALIRHLKLLQNNLGDFNDLSVQQEMLMHYLAEIRPTTIRSKKLSAAIGGLLTNLYHEHRQVRTRFEETFTRFTDKKNLALYRRLFS